VLPSCHRHALLASRIYTLSLHDALPILYIDPTPTEWKAICERPQLELAFLESSVKNIMNRVKHSGDDALLDITLQFDKVALSSRSEEHTSELQSRENLVCRLLLEKINSHIMIHYGLIRILKKMSFHQTG